MDTQSVRIAVAIMLLMEVGPAAGTAVLAPPPVPPQPWKNICGNTTIVCAEGSDSVIPWITFVISIPLVFVPGFIRIWRLVPEHLGMRHTFFVWSLILGGGDYIFWWFYTSPCSPAHAQFPLLLSSIYGFFAHAVLILTVTFRLPTSASGMRFISAVITAFLSLFICGLVWSHGYMIDASAVIGWFGLGLGVVSHLFRMKSTDYDNLNWTLLSFSLLGTFNGLLWLHSPDLCIARQYKIASYLVAALRATESFYWLSPSIGNRIRRMEGGDEVAGGMNIAMVQMGQVGAGQHAN